jgi:hypothetical protein
MLGLNFSIDSVIEEWIIFLARTSERGIFDKGGREGGDPGEDRGVQGILGRMETS